MNKIQYQNNHFIDDDRSIHPQPVENTICKLNHTKKRIQVLGTGIIQTSPYTACQTEAEPTIPFCPLHRHVQHFNPIIKNDALDQYKYIEKKIDNICHIYAKQVHMLTGPSDSFYASNVNWAKILHGSVKTKSRWTPDEAEVLSRLRQNKWKYFNIAFVVQRSYIAVKKKIEHLKKISILSKTAGPPNRAQFIQKESHQKKQWEQGIISHLLKYGLDLKDIALILQKDVDYISHFNKDHLVSKEDTYSLHSGNPATIDPGMSGVTKPKQADCNYLTKPHQSSSYGWQVKAEPTTDCHANEGGVWDSRQSINQQRVHNERVTEQQHCLNTSQYESEIEKWLWEHPEMTLLQHLKIRKMEDQKRREEMKYKN